MLTRRPHCRASSANAAIAPSNRRHQTEASGSTQPTTKSAAASPITTVRLERHPHMTSARAWDQRPRMPARRPVTSSTRCAAFVKSSVIGVNVSMAGMFVRPWHARVQRDLHGRGAGELLLDVAREQIVDQALSLLRVRCVGDQRHHVGHHGHAQAGRVRQHHRDRLPVLDRDVDVIGVGEADLDLSARDQVPDHRVAVDDLHVVGLQTGGRRRPSARRRPRRRARRRGRRSNRTGDRRSPPGRASADRPGRRPSRGASSGFTSVVL